MTSNRLNFLHIYLKLVGIFFSVTNLFQKSKNPLER